MVKLIKLSAEQERTVCGIAKDRGCTDEEIINEAIKLVFLFHEIESCGMELFYGKRVDENSFNISGIIEK